MAYSFLAAIPLIFWEACARLVLWCPWSITCGPMPTCVAQMVWFWLTRGGSWRSLSGTSCATLRRRISHCWILDHWWTWCVDMCCVLWAFENSPCQLRQTLWSQSGSLLCHYCGEAVNALASRLHAHCRRSVPEVRQNATALWQHFWLPQWSLIFRRRHLFMELHHGFLWFADDD